MKLPRRLPRPEILIIAGAAFLAFVITLAVLSSHAHAASVTALRERQSAAPQPLLRADELEITPEDYMVPDLSPVTRPPQYVPYRPRLPKWSQELVQKDWGDPREIVKEIVGSINDRNMALLFQNVP